MRSRNPTKKKNNKKSNKKFSLGSWYKECWLLSFASLEGRLSYFVFISVHVFDEAPLRVVWYAGRCDHWKWGLRPWRPQPNWGTDLDAWFIWPKHRYRVVSNWLLLRLNRTSVTIDSGTSIGARCNALSQQTHCVYSRDARNKTSCPKVSPSMGQDELGVSSRLVHIVWPLS